MLGTRVSRPLFKEYSRRAVDDRVRILMDDEVRWRIRSGLDKYYFRKGKGIKLSLRMAYEKTCKEELARVVVRDGIVGFVELPPAGLPTYGQFQYEFTRYKREKGPEAALKAREGERAFELKYREVLSDTTGLSQGPGAVYMVDAWLADVYLVSSILPGKVIGRPIVYILIDVFSHAVVGVGAGLEGPSWVGAMLALSNTASDKAAFCREYGIRIDTDEWPSHHLPHVLLADRGELEGHNADHLVRSLVHNKAAFSGMER